MFSHHFHTFAQWFYSFESFVPAIVATVGAALLIGCGIGANCSPCKEKDDFFHHHVL